MESHCNTTGASDAITTIGLYHILKDCETHDQ